MATNVRRVEEGRNTQLHFHSRDDDHVGILDHPNGNGDVVSDHLWSAEGKCVSEVETGKFIS